MGSTLVPPRSHPPADESADHLARWRTPALVVGGLAAITCVTLLFVGVDSTRLRVVVLLLASASIAAVAALLPTTWRARTALVATTFVAAAGFLPAVIAADPGPAPQPPSQREATVNADYLAQLLRQGPFTESLPAPLLVAGLADIGLEDASAAHRVDAVQVVITNSGAVPGLADVAALAWIETYRTEAEAQARAEAALAAAEERYAGLGGSSGDADGFCVVADTYWLCGGRRGTTYAEVDLSPNPNATNGLATGTVAALLDYAARTAKLAATD